MTTTYAVHATVLTHFTDRFGNEWRGSKGTPTFYLNAGVQGIVNAEHAAAIAADIINPLGLIAAADLRVFAYPVDVTAEPATRDQWAGDHIGSCPQTGHSAHTPQLCPSRNAGRG